MQRHGFLYVLLFGVFFSIGAAALGGSVLCDDFIRYCHNKHLVAEAQTAIERLESLNAEYDALLEHVEGNPELLQRIALVTLGTGPTDPNAISPRARTGQLAVARRALLKADTEEPAEPAIPTWLQRASDPPKRIILFIAGAALVLISLVCFTPDPAEEN
jgi:hypothetical protein